MFGAQQEGALNRKLPDRAAAPDGNRLAALQIAKIRGHIAGWKYIGQEQSLFVA